MLSLASQYRLPHALHHYMVDPSTDHPHFILIHSIKSLTNSQGNVLRRRGNAELVVEGAALAIITPGLLHQLSTADRHVTGRHREMQLKGTSCKRDIHTRKPGPRAPQLHNSTTTCC